MSKRKTVFCITSVAIYSGDGALMAKKYCEKMNLELKWGYNVYMPCNFDTPIPGFQIPPENKIRRIKLKANSKLDNTKALINIKTLASTLLKCSLDLKKVYAFLIFIYEIFLRLSY